MCSPPFLKLRSYLPADHPDKGLEMGSEATPADFLDRLLDVVEACDRVLAPHGSIVFELGDTYAGNNESGWDRLGVRAEQADQPPNYRRPNQPAPRLGRDRNRKSLLPAGAHSAGGGNGWPLDKSLCGIPTLFAWSLAYGRNLLRPERITEPWRIRNVVAWCRPNPPVGALGDKVRPATSYLTVACKARDRYFDLDAVRVPYDERSAKNAGYPTSYRADPDGGYDEQERTVSINPAGAPPLDYWVIPTQPYSEAHYATYPERLCEIPVKAMCPARVCVTCGRPSERTEDYAAARASIGDFNQRPKGSGSISGSRSVLNKAAGRDITSAENVTVGWTDCGCSDGPVIGQDPRIKLGHRWRNGVVLDPFAGSGTTLAVATGHGRDAIGIDIDARNADLAIQRVGPLFLTVEHHTRNLGACGSQ